MIGPDDVLAAATEQYKRLYPKQEVPPVMQEIALMVGTTLATQKQRVRGTAELITDAFYHATRGIEILLRHAPENPHQKSAREMTQCLQAVSDAIHTLIGDN